MKPLRFATMAFALSLGATLSAPAPALALTINGDTTTVVSPHLLGHSVNPCIEPSTVTSFVTTDRAAALWLSFSNASPADLLVVEWIPPTGNSGNAQSATVSQLGTSCPTFSLPIVNSPAMAEPGNWHVLLIVNGVETLNLTFRLTGPAITNKVIAGALAGSGTSAPTCAAPASQTSFLTWNADVNFWFAYKNGSAGDTFTIQWIHPSGKIDASQPFWHLLAPQASSCWGGFLPINGAEAATEPGIWNVSLLINGVQALTMPFTISAPGATITSPVPGSTLNGSTVTFSWDAVPGIASYGLCLGSTQGGSDFGCNNPGATTSITRNDVPTLGQKLYVTVTAIQGSKAAITFATYNEVHIENVGAVLTFPIVDHPGTFSPPLILEWSRVPGAVYLLTVGTTRPGSSNLVSIQGPLRSYTFSYPLDGETLYVRIETIYPDGVKIYHDYTFQAPNVLTTVPGPTGGSGFGGSGGGTGISGGSGSGSGAGGSGGSGDVPLLGGCFQSWYDSDQYDSDGSINPIYGYLIVQNNCGEAIYLEVFSGIYEALPGTLLPGDQTYFGFTSDDNPSIVACQGNYHPVDQFNSPITSAGQAWACAPD